MPDGANANANENGNENGNSNGNEFNGITPEYIQKIVFEELTKTGFQYDNMQKLVPTVIGRVMTENSNLIANYVSQMLVNGVVSQFLRGFKL